MATNVQPLIQALFIEIGKMTPAGQIKRDWLKVREVDSPKALQIQSYLRGVADALHNAPPPAAKPVAARPAAPVAKPAAPVEATNTESPKPAQEPKA